MIKKLSLFLLLILAPFASFADGSKPAVNFLPDAEVSKHAKTIKRVEEYLSGITTITSEFMQVAPDGSLTSGKFFLERPGRMRWQYNPPTPVLMVANGEELVYYDYELEQVSHIPLDSTLIGFLAQAKIHFDNSVGIISFAENAGTIRIGVAQREKPSDGQLVLEFSDKPILIRNMVVTDASGQVTTVSLNKANFGVDIDKKLFEFHDPRVAKRKK